MNVVRKKKEKRKGGITAAAACPNYQHPCEVIWGVGIDLSVVSEISFPSDRVTLPQWPPAKRKALKIMLHKFIGEVLFDRESESIPTRQKTFQLHKNKGLLRIYFFYIIGRSAPLKTNF